MIGFDYPGDTPDLKPAHRGTFVLEIDPRGVIQRTLGIALYSQGVKKVKVSENVEAGVPFSWAPQQALSPTGHRLVIASAQPGKTMIEVSIAETATDNVMTRHIPFPAVEIPRSRIDSALNRMIGRFALGTNRSVINEFKRNIPKHYNPVADLFIGLDDRIWLGMPADGATREWLVLDSQGHLTGRMVTPRKVTLKAANQTHAWGFDVDEFDVQSVLRYRIAPAK